MFGADSGGTFILPLVSSLESVGSIDESPLDWFI
jgi:hypothetical protein